MGFIYCIKCKFQGNLPKTNFLTSWLRQQSGYTGHANLTRPGWSTQVPAAPTSWSPLFIPRILDPSFPLTLGSQFISCCIILKIIHCTNINHCYLLKEIPIIDDPSRLVAKPGCKENGFRQISLKMHILYHK